MAEYRILPTSGSNQVQETWKIFQVNVPTGVEYEWLYAGIHPEGNREPKTHNIEKNSTQVQLDLKWAMDGYCYEIIAYKKGADEEYYPVASARGEACDLNSLHVIYLGT